jgi:hypothetical protein
VSIAPNTYSRRKWGAAAASTVKLWLMSCEVSWWWTLWQEAKTAMVWQTQSNKRHADQADWAGIQTLADIFCDIGLNLACNMMELS